MEDIKSSGWLLYYFRIQWCIPYNALKVRLKLTLKSFPKKNKKKDNAASLKFYYYYFIRVLNFLING